MAAEDLAAQARAHTSIEAEESEAEEQRHVDWLMANGQMRVEELISRAEQNPRIWPSSVTRVAVEARQLAERAWEIRAEVLALAESGSSGRPPSGESWTWHRQPGREGGDGL